MWKVFKRNKKKKDEEEVGIEKAESKRNILNKYKDDPTVLNIKRPGFSNPTGNIETIPKERGNSRISISNKESIMNDPIYAEFPDKIDSQAMLQAMLTNEEFVSLFYKFADDPQEMEDLSSAIYHISHAMRVDLKLMKCLLREEFASCSRTKSQVLRLNSLATKTVKHFIENQCRVYLKNLLHDPLLAFQKEGDNVNFQLNPLKIKHSNEEELQQNLGVNTDAFKKYCKLFLDAILSSEGRSTMPMHFLILASDIVSLSFQYDFNKRAILSGFFILRFINPGIVEAEKLRIIDERLSPKQIRELIQLVRVIQNASGKIHFGKAQSYMAPMNEVVQQYDVKFQQYYASLLLDTDKYQEEFQKYAKEGEDVVFNFQDENLLKYISILRSFLYKYREKIMKGLKVEAPLFHYFLKTGQGLQIEVSSVELEQRQKIDYLVNQLKDISRDNYSAFAKFKRFNKLQKVEKQNETIVAKISKDRVTEYENRLASMEASLQETKKKLKDTQEELSFYTKPSNDGDVKNFQVLKSTFDRMRAQYETRIRDINVEWYERLNLIQHEHTTEVEKERKDTLTGFEDQTKSLKEELATISQKYENRIAAMKRHENLVDYEEHQRFVETLRQQNKKLEEKSRAYDALSEEMDKIKMQLDLAQNKQNIQISPATQETPSPPATQETPLKVPSPVVEEVFPQPKQPVTETSTPQENQTLSPQDKLTQNKLMARYDELLLKEQLFADRQAQFAIQEEESNAAYKEREHAFDKKHQEQLSMIEALEAKAEMHVQKLDERAQELDDREAKINMIVDLKVEFNRLENEKKLLHLKSKQVREGLNKLEKREKQVMRGELELEQRMTELLHREAANKRLYEEQQANLKSRETSIKTMMSDVEISRKQLKEQQLDHQKSKSLFDIRYQRLLDEEKELNKTRHELDLKEKQLKVLQNENSQRKLQLSLAEQNLSFQMRESHIREEQLDRDRAALLSQSQQHYDEEETKLTDYRMEFEKVKAHSHSLKVSLVSLEAEKNNLEREIGRLYTIREQYSNSPSPISSPRSKKKRDSPKLRVSVQQEAASPRRPKKSPLFKRSPLIGGDSHLDQLHSRDLQPKLVERDMEAHIIASCEKKIAEALTNPETMESRETVAHLQSVIREMIRVRNSKTRKVEVRTPTLFDHPDTISRVDLEQQLAGYFT